jgi:hypothetical protein
MDELTYNIVRDALGNEIKIPIFHCEEENIAIRYFREEYVDGDRILDAWQRTDGWNGKGKEDYKADFIRALICGKNIPKIMEYTLKGDKLQKKRIIDGGHRTRAIDEFMKGEVLVKLGENYYFWPQPAPKNGAGDEDAESRPSRAGGGATLPLPRELMATFSKYKLTVVTYTNLTDEQAREKFNDLNHCSPMKVHEVINSHSSKLIEGLRGLWHDAVMTEEKSEEYDTIRNIFCLKNSDVESLKYMKVLISLFSLVERGGKLGEFQYCQPGDALIYARSHDDEGLHTQFDQESFEVEWGKFEDAMTEYQAWFENFTEEVEVEEGEEVPYVWAPTSHSEVLSVFHLHSSREFEDDADEKLRVFFESCHNYRKESVKLEKNIKKNVKENKDISALQTELTNIQSDLGVNVVDWFKSFKNNGSGSTNMSTRNQILLRVLL